MIPIPSQQPGDEIFTNSLPPIALSKPRGFFGEIIDDFEYSAKKDSFCDKKLEENLD